MESVFDDAFRQQLKDIYVFGEQRRMQAYNDVLFAYFHKYTTDSRHNPYIRSDVLAAVQLDVLSGKHSTFVENDWWFYYKTCFKKQVGDQEEKEKALEIVGLRTTIAYEGARPVQVQEVFDKTDILDRLSLMFGEGFVVRDKPANRAMPDEETDEWHSEQRTLVLCYYNSGIPKEDAERIAGVKKKYEDREVEELTIKKPLFNRTFVGKASEFRRLNSLLGRSEHYYGSDDE
jgi:hypothetical protein